jgi:hypothetical protein
MRRLIGAASVVVALALVACAMPARAQLPTPNPVSAPQPPDPEIAWDEAVLSWPAPTTFATPAEIAGASLADCATGPCMVRYIVEAKAPNGNGWGPIAVTDATTYRVKGLSPGTWYFRVKAFFGLTGYSPPGPIATKIITMPVHPEPVVSPPTSMNVR